MWTFGKPMPSLSAPIAGRLIPEAFSHAMVMIVLSFIYLDHCLGLIARGCMF